MCGRYSLYTERENDQLQAILAEIARRYPERFSQAASGEVFPSNWAPVLAHTGKRVAAGLARWGFSSPKGRGLVINARAETAAERPLFRDSLLERRCAVPATGFFEWDRSCRPSAKYRFTLPGQPMFYLAGCYRLEGEEARYTLFTTAANASMADIHPRMPVLLAPGQLEGWLTDTGAALALLGQTPPLLDRERCAPPERDEIQQSRLF